MSELGERRFEKTGPKKKSVETSSDRPGKSAKDWMGVTSDEGGRLAAITNDIYTAAENANDNDWGIVFTNRMSATSNFRLSDVGTRFTRSPDTIDRFPGLGCFQEQFTSGRIEHLSFEVHVQRDLQRPLLAAGSLLAAMFARLRPSIKGGGKEFTGTSLDITEVGGITVDNVQTMLDVESLLARFSNTPEELSALSARLLESCPNDEFTINEKTYKINPWGYSYLELFALAPFGLWAYMRDKEPERYNGVPIVHPHDTTRPFDPSFVFMITRVPPLGVNQRTSRHGGCPALHPGVRHYDLINRHGRLFNRALEEFLNRDSPEAQP
ncbi:MAG TPA: hypothetical protein VG102_02440 [Candidatus Paceibacterota bacterium]|jgi:hypothetical protein|nr:hypothetical protein [Candidatus Paceibacterota bacterium]